MKYRRSGNLDKGIMLAKQYNSGFISWKKFHDIEYVLEGEAFRIDFYTNDPYFGGVISCASGLSQYIFKTHQNMRYRQETWIYF